MDAIIFYPGPAPKPRIGPEGKPKEPISKPSGYVGPSPDPESLTRELIHIINTRDFRNPITSRMDSAMEYDADWGLHTRDKESLLQGQENYAAQNPEYHLEIMNASTEVNEGKGRAKVWMLLEVTGIALGVRKESIILMYWRLRGGRWCYYPHKGLRGVGGY